jgi:integrase
MLARINAVCRKNDLPEIGMHGLRHSFASLAYHLKISEKIAMQIGGWADATTMHKIYTHIGKADILKSENLLKEFFENAN